MVLLQIHVSLSLLHLVVSTKKCYHTVCGLLKLAIFIQCYFARFIHVVTYIVFYCKQKVFIHFLNDGHSSNFHIFAWLIRATMKTWILYWKFDYEDLKSFSRNGFAGSPDRQIFTLGEKGQIIAQSGCTTSNT